jgi:hypothetical protein
MPVMAHTHAAIHNRTANDALDDEERELMDPETWDWDSTVVGTPVADVRLSFRIEFADDDLALIERASQDANMPLTRYIKQAVLEKARRATA